jgi:RNA polymerase sigma-70 factor (ECF subfamily)
LLLPELTQHTEQDLLQKVADGNELAFSELFYHHHQHLANYVYQLTASKEMAQEVVQDVFLKVWNNRQLLAGIENFRPWLYVVSKNMTLNCLRKIVRERAQHRTWSIYQAALTEDETMPLEAGTEDEKYAIMIDAISQLSPQQKKVFFLSRIKKMKYAEIARQLKLSRETVKSYLKLANSSISKFVSGHSSLFSWLAFVVSVFRG